MKNCAADLTYSSIKVTEKYKREIVLVNPLDKRRKHVYLLDSGFLTCSVIEMGITAAAGT